MAFLPLLNGSRAAQPGVEIVWPLEVEQGIGQGLQLGEGQALNAGGAGRTERATAPLQQPQRKRRGLGLTAFLAAFLTAFLAAQVKDLFVGDAAGEVVDGDPTHGADLGDGAAVKP